LIAIGLVAVFIAVGIGMKRGWLDNAQGGMVLLACVLAVFLAAAVYRNFELGGQLDRVCELLGPHDVWIGSPRTAREEIDDICIGHQPDD